MEKVINIGGKDVKLKASAATLVHYRSEFMRDMLADISEYAKGENTNNVLECSAYIMAKDADPTILPFEEWLEEFGLTAFSNASKDIIGFWNSSAKPIEKPKKKADQRNES